MKKFIFNLLFVCLATVLFISCDDEIDLSEQVNNVTYKVKTDSEVSFIINGFHGNNLVTKGNWEHSEKTKETFAMLCISCDSASALLSVEIYKNGKLLKKQEGNSFINVKARLK